MEITAPTDQHKAGNKKVKKKSDTIDTVIVAKVISKKDRSSESNHNNKSDKIDVFKWINDHRLSHKRLNSNFKHSIPILRNL